MAEVGRDRIRGVIFDLDGVITDTAEFHYLAWQRIADEVGVAFDRRRNEQLRGVSREESLRLLLGARELPEHRFDELMARKNRYYLESLSHMGPDYLLEGARCLVQALRDRGCAVAIGSSSKNAELVLERLGVRPLFDAVADGTSAPRAKPDPGIFLAAAARLGVEPGASVVVEDAASGVDAARAGGMLVVGIGPSERVGHADLRYERTADADVDEILALTPLSGRPR